MFAVNADCSLRLVRAQRREGKEREREREREGGVWRVDNKRRVGCGKDRHTFPSGKASLLPFISLCMQYY